METSSRVLIRARDKALRLDMPELLGGSNRGLMPLEAILGAYAASLSVVGSFVAKTMDFDLRHLEFTISAQLDPRGMYGLTSRPQADPLGARASAGYHKGASSQACSVAQTAGGTLSCA